VIEVEPGLPEGGAGEGVEVPAHRAFGENQPRDADHALQYAGEAVLHLRRRRADDDGAGDIGGAVTILAARIDEEDLVQAKLAVRGGGDLVVRDRRVRPGAGNGVEGNVGQFAGVAPERFQVLDGRDLIQPALRRFPV
jgi:hypothetical protein